jgi:cytohesin
MRRYRFGLSFCCLVLLAACSKSETHDINPYQPSTVQTSLPAPPSPANSPVNINRQLIAAAEIGDVKTIEELLRAGADVNTKGGSYNNTPLIQAASAGKEEAVRLLIEKGADVNATNQGGYAAMDVAEEEYQDAVLNLLKEARGKKAKPSETISKADSESDLRQAATDGDLDKIRRILKHGVNINARGENGWTALRCAVFQENLEAVNLLLTRKANPNLTDTQDGTTPLHWAAQVGNTEMVKALLEAGANPNVRDKTSGVTPLYSAATGGYVETAKALLAKGANPNVKDQFGDSILSEVRSSYESALRRGKPDEAASLSTMLQVLSAAGAR